MSVNIIFNIFFVFIFSLHDVRKLEHFVIVIVI